MEQLHIQYRNGNTDLNILYGSKRQEDSVVTMNVVSDVRASMAASNKVYQTDSWIGDLFYCVLESWVVIVL
ncbi:hypothetical protein RHGRI_026727 [Rhododendron griersonianum]|uniref:Uncharacterized protein n=1 Tax=Rhododendron griersonianum TaxID=479676 RepID=A0AAV6IXQ0_9ERIC|nr:hypothetical protein RHGRI_026727 [Rhododendron griersonianum]